jgi:hypothetical protein
MEVVTQCAVVVEITSNGFWKQLRGAEELARQSKHQQE